MTAEAGNATPDAERGSGWRRRLARVLLIAGVGIALARFLPSLPRDQSLVFSIGADRSRVRALEATWTREGETEALGGVELRFADAAPSRIRHRVRLPNGRYEVAVELATEDDGGLAHTSTTRRVTLEGGETVIRLDSP